MPTLTNKELALRAAERKLKAPVEPKQHQTKPQARSEMHTVCRCGGVITQKLVGTAENPGPRPLLGRMTRCASCASAIWYQRCLGAWYTRERQRAELEGFGKVSSPKDVVWGRFN